MRNAEATRQTILEVSSQLFNTYGYEATSISDITKQLGMTKGAIYRHFERKSDLEREALVYMCKEMGVTLGSKIRMASTVEEKMKAIFNYFISYTKNSPFPGGCPLLNAAIEADDANPELKIVVNEVIDMIYGSILRRIE